MPRAYFDIRDKHEREKAAKFALQLKSLGWTIIAADQTADEFDRESELRKVSRPAEYVKDILIERLEGSAPFLDLVCVSFAPTLSPQNKDISYDQVKVALSAETLFMLLSALKASGPIWVVTNWRQYAEVLTALAEGPELHGKLRFRLSRGAISEALMHMGRFSSQVSDFQVQDDGSLVRYQPKT